MSFVPVSIPEDAGETATRRDRFLKLAYSIPKLVPTPKDGGLGNISSRAFLVDVSSSFRTHLAVVLEMSV